MGSPEQDSSQVINAPEHETSTVATLQSLIVAFVLAMTFRGFVTEGFVIPTGSMAPTLMGEHLLIHSNQTGYTYPVDAKGANLSGAAVDPMLGPNYPLSTISPRTLRHRMGDRILVLKGLYPFSNPSRFDVVVFKNPTDPDGDAENYIKRLIGLPNEAIWLTDGDVFVAPAVSCDDWSAYEIQRKPQHVQRAVWRPVYHSDFIPVHPNRLSGTYASPWSGPAWETADRRSYRCEVAQPSTLSWDNQQLRLSDWTSYNMFSMSRSLRAGRDTNISDLRIAAAVVADQDGLIMSLHLDTRGYQFEFSIGDGVARMRMRPLDARGPWIHEQATEVEMPRAGRVYNVEFWHVDQAMSIWINGSRVGEPLEYDWAPPQRIEQSYGMPIDAWKQRSPRLQPGEANLRWNFAGSPLTLHRVQVDRDLYYRVDTLTTQATRNATPPGHDALVRPGSPAFGTHPDKPAVLGPDHFFMLGDNSAASSDSRLWGNPHPYVVHQIDDSPFLVHRRLLLGKAWLVYFPAPYPLTENGPGLVPSFGNMRFIR